MIPILYRGFDIALARTRSGGWIAAWSDPLEVERSRQTTPRATQSEARAVAESMIDVLVSLEADEVWEAAKEGRMT